MALPTTISPMGATISLGVDSPAQTFNVLSFNPLEGAETATRDVTHLGTTVSRQKKPGTLIDWGTMTMTIQFDGVTPVMGVAGTITITWNTNSPATTLTGTGWVSGWSIDSSGGDEEEATATLTITWDGNTKPTLS